MCCRQVSRKYSHYLANGFFCLLCEADVSHGSLQHYHFDNQRIIVKSHPSLIKRQSRLHILWLPAQWHIPEASTEIPSQQTALLLSRPNTMLYAQGALYRRYYCWPLRVTRRLVCAKMYISCACFFFHQHRGLELASSYLSFIVTSSRQPL